MNRYQETSTTQQKSSNMVRFRIIPNRTQPTVTPSTANERKERRQTTKTATSNSATMKRIYLFRFFTFLFLHIFARKNRTNEVNQKMKSNNPISASSQVSFRLFSQQNHTLFAFNTSNRKYLMNERRRKGTTHSTRSKYRERNKRQTKHDRSLQNSDNEWFDGTGIRTVIAHSHEWTDFSFLLLSFELFSFVVCACARSTNWYWNWFFRSSQLSGCLSGMEMAHRNTCFCFRLFCSSLFLGTGVPVLRIASFFPRQSIRNAHRIWLHVEYFIRVCPVRYLGHTFQWWREIVRRDRAIKSRNFRGNFRFWY